MKNILMISGHPNLDNSVANRTIIEEIEKQLPEIQIHKLDKLEPSRNFRSPQHLRAYCHASKIMLKRY